MEVIKFGGYTHAKRIIRMETIKFGEPLAELDNVSSVNKLGDQWRKFLLYL